MKSMNWKFLWVVTFLFSVQLVNAQTLETVTKAYNDAIQNANEEPSVTIEALKKVITDCAAVGETGNEIKTLAESKLPALQYKIAYNHYQEKAYGDAITAFEETVAMANQYGDEEVAAQVKGKLPTLYYIQGRTVLKEKKMDEAMEMFNRAIVTDSGYAKAYFGKALAFWLQGKVDSTINYTDQALALAEDDEKTYSQIGQTMASYMYKKAKSYNSKGQNQDALTLLEKAMNYDSSEELDRYYFEMGKAYAGMNNKAKACESYSKAGGKYLEAAEYEIKYTLKCS